MVYFESQNLHDCKEKKRVLRSSQLSNNWFDCTQTNHILCLQFHKQTAAQTKRTDFIYDTFLLLNYLIFIDINHSHYCYYIIFLYSIFLLSWSMLIFKPPWILWILRNGKNPSAKSSFKQDILKFWFLFEQSLTAFYLNKILNY